ncbi:hypothetical protein ABBQ32_011999 [Trebouxia sp. C0010 RCD-2024]
MALDGTSHGKSMQGLELQPQNLTISSGCGAIINNLIYCITEPGEGVALPTPYYPAFDYDIKVRGSEEPYDQQLQRAADEYQQKTGKRLAVLLVTNPDNPTGTVYSKERLLQMLTWCCKNKVHLISPQEHGLPSADVQSYVHVMFGLSKDWCASGLRVGCLWTLNEPVQSAIQNLSYFCGVSGLAQHMLADMLEDTAFVRKYVKENLSRLGAAYDTLAGALTKASISFTPAVASVFCWVDLRSALPEATWEAERQLWEEGFVQRCGFIITPGQSCHAAEPGFFRICYAIVDKDTILELVDRLVNFVAKTAAERQEVPLWISRDSLQKAQQQIKNDPAQPKGPVQHGQ